MHRARARRPCARSGVPPRTRWSSYLVGAACIVLGFGAPAAQEPPSADLIGVRANFDDLILRDRLRQAGWLVHVGLNDNVPGILLLGLGTGTAFGTIEPPPELVPPLGTQSQLSPPVARVVPDRPARLEYSADLGVVFELGGPGYMQTPPDYYFAEGVYPVYDPDSFDDPSIRVRAVPRAVFEAEHAAAERQALLRRLQHSRGSAEEGLGGTGINITVPITMPGALAEVFGRGATSLRVSGRENLAFAGESRRISPYVPGELGKGQSLFPRLDMKQELQVKLEGTIGDKVHVQVDHNSAGFGADANRINIYYQGYDDDIVQRVDLGGTNLALPGASLVAFSGGRSGLFGIKSEMKLGGLKLNLVASKEEAQVESRALSSRGGAAREIRLLDNNYARDRFFFYVMPDTLYLRGPYQTYGIPHEALLTESQEANFQVWVDTQIPATEQERSHTGFAVVGLPAGGDTIAMRQAWEQAPPTSRYPLDARDGHWKKLERPDDYDFVKFTLGTQVYILGFYLRNGAAGISDAIGITVDAPQDSIGAVLERSGAVPEVRLRLIRHPDQNTSFDKYPSALYMMRHVYVLGPNEINPNTFDLRIARTDNSQTPDVPDNVPGSTYLHMFGLDEYNNATGARVPDGLIDDVQNLVDYSTGFLYMPGLRPFYPPRQVIVSRLQSAGVDSVEAENNPDQFFPPNNEYPSYPGTAMYTLPPGATNIPQRYALVGSATGTDTEIILQNDIIEGSEIVKVDGRTLQRGTDYDIENFAGGRITLKGEALSSLSPTSTIEVTYQFLPLFGGGKSTLLGASGEYELGNRGRLGSVLLYESTGSATKHVKFGEEPTRSVVGDVNGTLRFEPRWMTKLVGLLPFTTASNPSQLNLNAEVAASFPNPNTKDIAYADDMEGADESDEQSTSRNAWSYASIPLQVIKQTTAVVDTALRIPLAYYNPVGEVRRGHLNPTLGENEINDGINVLELGFDQKALEELQVSGDAQARYAWSGIMRSFGTAGLDLTQTKSIELWLNDYIGDPSRRHGKMHIDLGDISEDFILFDNTLDNPTSHFNREGNSESEFQATLDDLGWDNVQGNCPDNFPKTCEERQAQYPFGIECYAPEITNCRAQHYLANGSEGNNSYDTEDLNNNGRFDDRNSYFDITIDLADTSFVVTDVNPLYANDPTINQDLKPFFYGWRKYRVDLERVISKYWNDPGEVPPSLRKISYMRIWFEDPDAPPDQSILHNDLQLYGIRLTRTQWVDLGFFAVDSTSVPSEPLETFSVGTINNKDDSSYDIPPDAILIDEQGSQSREQALRLDLEQLQAGREVVAERQLSGLARGLDFTQYNQMKYFVKPAPSTEDTLEFFFRCGTDTLNYYEIAHTVAPHSSWQEITVDLTQLTGLKFPEDYPGAEFKYVYGRTAQVTAPTADKVFPELALRVTLRGAPSLTAITRFYCGIRNPAGDFPSRGGEPRGTPRGAALRPPISGELWFDNVRLLDPERVTGLAQSYTGNAKLSDVFDLSASYSANNADFRGLQQRIGSNFDRYRFQGSLRTEISRLVPTLGFSIPVNYGYSRDRSLPKFFTSSDTRNTDERKLEQRSEGLQTNYGFSIQKRPSRSWISKVTLDPLSFTYSKSFNKQRTYTSRDTSEARARSLKYTLSPRERGPHLWGNTKLNLLPTNINLQAQDQISQTLRYNVFHPRVGTSASDSLVVQPLSVSRGLTLNASTALRPLQILNARYSFNEARDYRTAHPANESERFSFFGYDFGLPKGRSEGLSIDLTPRRFRFNYSTQFSDQRTFLRQQDGSPLPDLHAASSNRTGRLQFDFGLHRRIMGWVLPKPKEQPNGTRPSGRSPQTPPAPPPGEQPPDREPDEELQGREDFTPPVGVPAPGDSSQAPAAGAPGESPQRPSDGPAGPVAGTPVAVDTTIAPPRHIPNPVTGLLRKVADIEPIKVEYSNGRNAGYTGLSDTPTGAFRYGFSTASGLEGAQFEIPQTQTTRQTLDLQSGLPLRGALRIGIRYKLDTSVTQRRSYDPQQPSVLRNLSEDHNTDVTFPSLDLAINNIERIRLFGNRLDRSNVTLGYSRSTNRRFNTNQLPGGPKVEGNGRTETTRDNLTANWAGQWKRGVSTSLNLTRGTNGTLTAGQRSQGVTYSVTGTVRFKIAPKGGLKLPFLGSRGMLKSGMDVSLNGSYSTDVRKRFNDPSRPDFFVRDSASSSLTFGARGDYTLSRNMTGGIDLGYTRTRNDVANQTVNLVRLGFNIAFQF